MYNLLEHALIRTTLNGGNSQVLTLPEVYTWLTADEIMTFPALRPHQRHAWHAFLVQLGTMAILHAKERTLPQDPRKWRELIRGLTPKFPDDEPWQLVVDDITKPAFLQPPASSKEFEADFKFLSEAPDELDILESSKNHDLKASIARRSDCDDWIAALITVQTQGGRGDRYYQGASRMKGGGYSRTAFSLSTCESDGTFRPGVHVGRDIVMMIEGWESYLDTAPDFFDTIHGIKLLWTVEWDGAKNESLLPTTLHPLYIETCRRIRLCEDANGALVGRKATTRDAPRIEAKQLKGNLGDPWTVVDTKGEALGIRSEGLLYRRLVDCFDAAKFKLPYLGYPTESELQSAADMVLVARGVARFSEGRRAVTAGYHERIIPLRPKVLRTLRRSSAAQQVGFSDIANSRIQEIAVVETILRDAIATLLIQGKNIYDLEPGDRNRVYTGDKIKHWLKQLDEMVDGSFFQDLQTEFEADCTSKRISIRRDWLNGVVNNALTILHSAGDSLPYPAIYRHRSRVAGEVLFKAKLRASQRIQLLFDNEGE